MSKKKPLVILVKGVEYTVFLQTLAAYKRKHQCHSHAIMYPTEKEIYFTRESLIPKWIGHELFHAYSEECNTECSELTVAQTEEQGAMITGIYGAEILNLIFRIIGYYSVV